MRHTYGPGAAVLLGLVVAASSCDSCTTSERYTVRQAAHRIPDEICVKGSVYLECMSANREGCMETATEGVREFFSRYRDDPVMYRPKPGQTWRDAIRNYVQRRFDFYHTIGPVPWEPETEFCKRFEEEKERAYEQKLREWEAQEREELDKHGSEQPAPASDGGR